MRTIMRRNHPQAYRAPLENKVHIRRSGCRGLHRLLQLASLIAVMLGTQDSV
jgi:hypothetical protein